jgi:hypothetical protein
MLVSGLLHSRDTWHNIVYLAKITKLGNSPAAARGGSMVVNTEWGAFNNSVSTGHPTALLGAYTPN